ncbi:MAG: saccharopine dehydrogenase NADP-binding domain-containing protein, partial [Paracoccaceae bacterium]
MTFKNIAVLGLGNVGSLAAKLLHEADFNVTGYDVSVPQRSLPFEVRNTDVRSPDALARDFGNIDAVLSCLPYSLNIDVARAAHTASIHYFDLTEDVPTTDAIIALSKSSKGLMAPQCGLAPGFVGIVGAAYIAKFDTCRSVRLRVGALPQHPTGLLGYAFNWSPVGVVNEYLNDCEGMEEGGRNWVSPW